MFTYVSFYYLHAILNAYGILCIRFMVFLMSMLLQFFSSCFCLS